MSGLTVMSGDGIVYDIVLGEPYEVVSGYGVCKKGDLISFKRKKNSYYHAVAGESVWRYEFSWSLNNIEQGPCNRISNFNTVFRPCNPKSLADMLKECLE
jgi:hypothetical protein